MVTLANGFAERGFGVDLVVAGAEGPYARDVAPTVNVVDLRAQRVIGSVPALARYLRRERPKAMLSAVCHANVAAVWAREWSGTGTRLAVSEHGLARSRQQTRTIRSRFLPALMRRAYPRADAVVAVSQGVADDLAGSIGLPRSRIRVVYNPIVTERLLALSRLPVRHPGFSTGAPPVVLAAGRLTAEKGFSSLIRAFAQLRAARPARLVILGEGELRAELQTLVAQVGLEADVLLPGFVDNPYAWMRHASVFVLSSLWEGFGNVLVEAMACGAPVVSTDCPGGPAEILENGRWGSLVPVGDEAAMAAAIAAALDAPEHPDVTRRARDFSVAQAVDGYLAALLGDHSDATGREANAPARAAGAPS